ncbi:hypothetical protein GCM10010300_42880 [Streptomyces olivaceoviridis]|nr:hypothetical protein GCM10010300_42880 [Streptomyces olivaceoviridis]
MELGHSLHGESHTSNPLKLNGEYSAGAFASLSGHSPGLRAHETPGRIVAPACAPAAEPQTERVGKTRRRFPDGSRPRRDRTRAGAPRRRAARWPDCP